ncbi:MAG TPA: TetR/AcrR family transcriptional regulator [Streptosporangiaceae bacterium]|nr:TetR/AcrR family transcriptional regulator [Streptosporangiaceae bacterium]
MTEAISGHRRGPQGSLSGRQAEAARNDQRILDSARKVFIADPGAPITAVAKHAGVGISALYTRYASKEELLRKLCTDGLARFVAETEAALDAVRAGGDHWEVFARYMRTLVDADTSSMTLALAGKFTPTPEMFALADRSAALSAEFFGEIRDVLRADLDVNDVGIVFEIVGAIKFSSPERTQVLRHRYLAVILDGMRASEREDLPGPLREDLPGPPPAWQEVSERWNPAG